MARRIPYTFWKDVVTTGKSPKSMYEAKASIKNRSTPGDDAPVLAGDSWIF